MEAELQGRERLRRTGSSRAPCQWGPVRKRACFGSCASFSPSSSACQKRLPTQCCLAICQRIAGERGFSCGCAEAQRALGLRFSLEPRARLLWLCVLLTREEMRTNAVKGSAIPLISYRWPLAAKLLGYSSASLPWESDWLWGKTRQNSQQVPPFWKEQSSLQSSHRELFPTPLLCQPTAQFSSVS